MKCCSDCIWGELVCVHYDMNPYEQEWMGRCNKGVIKELIDPSDMGRLTECKEFTSTED